MHEVIDQLHYLSNFADEDVIDWNSTNFNDYEWLVRLTKEDNNYTLQHKPEDLGIEWESKGFLLYQYSTNCPENAVEDILDYETPYEFAIKLAFKLKAEVDQLKTTELNPI